MRLHSLRLQAFGPFARRHTVDFDALPADGLFLLHGDTGADKSTCSPPSASPPTACRLTNATRGCAAITLPQTCRPK
ncbi:AAA family ATPase [Streptomyces sp. NPDC058992]|uniref:AAA family ATPase n=1 Tax=Streptomyces sp. NPDC058992 TaxID=3346688 RepID=UPI0036A2F1B6